VSHYKVTVLERLQPQSPASPPAFEHDQQDCAESPPYPSAPPSPAGSRDTDVSLPAVSFADNNSQPIYTEKTVTIDEHDYAHHLPMHPSTEVRAGPMNKCIPLQGGQFGLAQSVST
jgi:hypothetical protein